MQVNMLYLAKIQKIWYNRHMKAKFKTTYILFLLFSIMLNGIKYASPFTATKSKIDLDFKNEYIGDLDYTKYSFLIDDLNDNSVLKRNQPEDEYHIYGKNNWFFRISSFEKDILEAKKVITKEWLESTTSKMSVLNKLCKEHDKTLCFIMLPWKDLVYDEYLPDNKFIKYDTSNDIDKFVEFVKDNSDVPILYPINELKQAKQYARIYYTHDSHYNKIGAFIVFQNIYHQLGFKTTKLSELQIKKNYDTSSHYGEFDYDLSYTGNGNLLNEEINGHDIANSSSMISTSTSNVNKKVAIVGDSYRFWIYDYMKTDFSKTVNINKGTLGGSLQKELIRESDYIIVESVTDTYWQLPQVIDNLINFLNI